VSDEEDAEMALSVGDSVLHVGGNVYKVDGVGKASTPEEIAHAKANGFMWTPNDYISFRKVDMQTGRCKGPSRHLKPGSYKLTVAIAE
jgi:hypothetical protein